MTDVAVPPFDRLQRRRVEHELLRARVVARRGLQPAHVAAVAELGLAQAAHDLHVERGRQPLHHLLGRALAEQRRRERAEVQAERALVAGAVAHDHDVLRRGDEALLGVRLVDPHEPLDMVGDELRAASKYVRPIVIPLALRPEPPAAERLLGSAVDHVGHF